jgi:N-methylhydantoinase A/oxoprolinase/acetone carboxylase beta subunit
MVRRTGMATLDGANKRIGIDVGGTNTDAVLMEGDAVLAAVKRPTTKDVASGVIDAVEHLLGGASARSLGIRSVMIGTTQFINAFVQRRGLARIAAIRVTLPKADAIPPMMAWPEDLITAVDPDIHLVGGGSFYTGVEYAPLDELALVKAGEEIRAKGIGAIAITANFAPVRPDLETRAEKVVRSVLPDAEITLSHQVGGVGLLDRENAALINASLSRLSRDVIASLRQALEHVGLDVPIYISQNDGTLISEGFARRYPIFTCSAGPTNSIRGAAFLTGLKDGIVIDVGGTTTDIGALAGGFPRETATPHYIGGVRTNFRMPDVLSLALGGGTLVGASGETVTLGPESVGYELTRRGRAFGGQDLTTTDCIVRLGKATIGHPEHLDSLPIATAQRVYEAIQSAIERGIDQVKTNSRSVPAVLVGGGNILVSRELQGVSRVEIPRYADAANAVGAAIARVSGRVDRIFDFHALGRDAALAQAKQEAVEAAVCAGASRATVEVVEVIELPMTHMPTGAVQVKVRAVGDLAAAGDRDS